MTGTANERPGCPQLITDSTSPPPPSCYVKPAAPNRGGSAARPRPPCRLPGPSATTTWTPSWCRRGTSWQRPATPPPRWGRRRGRRHWPSTLSWPPAASSPRRPSSARPGAPRIPPAPAVSPLSTTPTRTTRRPWHRPTAGTCVRGLSLCRAPCLSPGYLPAGITALNLNRWRPEGLTVPRLTLTLYLSLIMLVVLLQLIGISKATKAHSLKAMEKVRQTERNRRSIQVSGTARVMDFRVLRRPRGGVEALGLMTRPSTGCYRRRCSSSPGSAICRSQHCFSQIERDLGWLGLSRLKGNKTPPYNFN